MRNILLTVISILPLLLGGCNTCGPVEYNVKDHMIGHNRFVEGTLVEPDGTSRTFSAKMDNYNVTDYAFDFSLTETDSQVGEDGRLPFLLYIKDVAYSGELGDVILSANNTQIVTYENVCYSDAEVTVAGKITDNVPSKCSPAFSYFYIDATVIVVLPPAESADTPQGTFRFTLRDERLY